MTNTLHRYGDADSFSDDVIIFAIACKGKNDEGAVERLRTFLQICAEHDPVNMGNSDFSSYRPSSKLKPSIHWNRTIDTDKDSVINGVHRTATTAAVFDSHENDQRGDLG
ncbi:MAG: hypothetical protein P8X82_18835 [Gemmatimonadales bacterium]